MSHDSPCHPLIGIDIHNNEHPLEISAPTAAAAAKIIGERRKYTRVLSGYAGQKRSADGRGLYYRKELWAAAPRRFAEQTFDQLVKTFNAQVVKNPNPLIKYVRERGMELVGKRVAGKLKISCKALITCTLTEDEQTVVAELLRDDPSTFIEALEADAVDVPDEEQPESPPRDEQKGKTINSILLSMLPQMPSVFCLNDLLERLKSSGYIELSQDKIKVRSNLHAGAIYKGFVVRVPGQRDRFQVSEAIRHRRKDSEESKGRKEAEPPPIAEAQPTTPPVLDSQRLVPPREAIEVPSPATAAAVDTTVPTTPAAMEAAPTPALPAAITTILDLAAQAAVGAADSESLCRGLTDACELFENTMLEAITTLTSSVKRATEQLNHQALARKSLVKSLSGIS